MKDKNRRRGGGERFIVPEVVFILKHHVRGGRATRQYADLWKKKDFCLFSVCIQEDALLVVDALVFFFLYYVLRFFWCKGMLMICLTPKIYFRAHLEEFKVGELIKLNKHHW